MFKNKKGFMRLVKAFTLAEVLVTVSVIGVVAMLVLPNLYRSTDARVSKAAAKKAKMEVYQVAMKVQMECPRFRCRKSDDSVDDVIKKFFPEDTTEIIYYFYEDNAKKVAIDVGGNNKLDFGYQYNADGSVQEIGTGNCTFAKTVEGKTTCTQTETFKINTNVYSKRS